MCRTARWNWNSTRKRLSLPEHNYRGRFAPSPTGPLHFGSLVAAVGSYLDAKHHNGIWLVRMEDLDTPRCVPGAADNILRTLEAFGLHSDEPVIYQSRRADIYEAALQRLQDCGAAYPCYCTRKEIADSALHGIEGYVYPGTCRSIKQRPTPLAPLPPAGEGKQPARTPAWRVRTDIHIAQTLRSAPAPEGASLRANGMREQARSYGDAITHEQAGVIQFVDALQGGHPDTVRVSDECGRDDPAAAPANGCFAETCRSRITQHLETEIGDFVVKRADGLFAYQLAVVVDDAAQGITHVVRGADLLASTARQIYLQRLLGLPTPHYMHLPVAVNAAGEKLSKQTLASAVDSGNPVAVLLQTLHFLRQQPPAALAQKSLDDVWEWAIRHWQPERLRGVLALPAVADELAQRRDE